MTLQKYYFLLLFFLGISLCGTQLYAKTSLKSAIAVSNTANIGTIKAMLQSEDLEKLYSRSYYSLLDRMQGDGFLPESLTGAYPGMYPRTTGAYVLLLIETGRLKEAELTIKCVLDALSQNNMERVCHVINKDNSRYTTNTDDAFQIDGQAHVILAWARLAIKRGHTQFEDNTWAQVSALMARTCDRTFFDCGWGEPKLVMNTAFEHSRDSRYWDCWDLLTQSFVGAAMSDMIKIARRRSETDLANNWKQKISLLAGGVRDKLVVNRDGKPTYIEMLVPKNGNGGIPYLGVSWVNLSPIAAGWEGVDHQVMRNTVAYMENHFLQTTNGIRWMPTDMYSDGSFTNSVIGKGIGWELEFARSENNYTRMKEILQLIRSANINSHIYMEFAWLDGTGYAFQTRLSTGDIPKMNNLPWRSRDAGNGEQTSWFCWAMARLRKSVGLSPEPARIKESEIHRTE